MTSNPATVKSNPARDFWVRTWVWLTEHKKTSLLLIFVVVCTVSQLILISPAWGSTVYGLPSEDLEDSHGVPLSRYANLPFDEGGTMSPVRSARYLLASIMWMPYNFLVIAMIVMTDWILDFGWLEWIAAPVNLLIGAIDGVLSGMGIVVVGALVAALIIAIGFLRGRTGKSIAEMGIVIVMFGVIATSLASPNEWITGDDGWVNNSADFGAEVGEEMTNDEQAGGGEGESDSLVSGALIDMTLREPLLHMSFGSNLADLEDCEARWNDNASDLDNSTEDIRTEVTNCHDSVEAANETNDLSFTGFYFMGVLTAIGLMFLLAVALVFLIKEVVMALFGAVNTVVKSYFALFPGGARYAFINALMQTVVSVVMIGVYVWALMAYLWVIDLISQLLPGFMGPAALMFGVVVIIMAITFIMMKIQGKKVGQSISRALGRGGLSGSEGPQGKPSRLGAASRHAGQGMRNAYQRTRMIRAATAATRVGTAAASGGTSAAIQGGAMAAKKVGTNLAAKQGTKAAMMRATKPAGNSAPTAAAAQGTQARAKTSTPGRLSTHGATGTKRAQPTSGEDSTRQGASIIGPQSGVNETPAGPVSNLPAAGTQRRGLPVGQAQTHTGSVGPKPEMGRTQPQHGPGGGHLASVGGTTHDQAPGAEQVSSNSASRPSSLPPGRYGKVWVHKDGTATTVLEGEAESAPSTSKLDKAWTIASPEVPTARSKRQGITAAGGMENPRPRGTPAKSPQQGATSVTTKPRNTADRRSQPAVERAADTPRRNDRSRSSERAQKAHRQREQATRQRTAQQAQPQPQKPRNERRYHIAEKVQQEKQRKTSQRPEQQASQSWVRRAAESQEGDSA